MSNLVSRILFVVIIGSCLQARAYPETRQDSLLVVLARNPDGKARINILMQLSNETPASKQQALNYGLQALKLANQAEDDRLKVECLLNASMLYYTFSDLRNSMATAQEAKILAEKHDYQKELALALDNIGRIYYDIGDLKKCPEYYFASLKISEKLNNKTDIGITLSRIALLYGDQNDFKNALAYLNRAYKLALELNDKAGTSSILNNFATFYSKMNNYTMSLKYLEEALKISKGLKFTSFEATNYMNIGRNYFKLNNYAKAESYNLQALKLFEEIGDKRSIATCRLNQGKIALELQHLAESRENAVNALAIGTDEGIKDVIYMAYRLLHSVYRAQKDSANAYKFCLLENQWKDSLALVEKENNLASLELQYQLDKKEQQDLADRKRKTILNTSVIIVLVLIVVVILLILYQLRLKEKKTTIENDLLSKELGFKKKELTMHVMSLMKRNEMLSQVYKNIVEIEKETASEEIRQALKKVLKELHHTTAEENMKEFMLRFREVHEGFYDALLKRFPDLSPSELRLCAFLKLNMTTKEISELTGQQMNSLEMARYRLRMKLGISNSEVNLVTFLAQV